MTIRRRGEALGEGGGGGGPALLLPGRGQGYRTTTARSSMDASPMVIGTRVARSSRYSVVTPFRVSVVTPPPPPPRPKPPPTGPLTTPPLSVARVIPPARPGTGVRATTMGAIAVSV